MSPLIRVVAERSVSYRAMGDQMQQLAERVRQMETILTSQQHLIGSLQARSDRGDSRATMLESRSFHKMSKYSGERDAWADWAPVLLSYISTISIRLKTSMEAALAVDFAWNANLEDEDVKT